MQKQTHKNIYPTTEIATAFLSYECENNNSLCHEVKQNPISAILSFTNLELRHLEIQVVENTTSEHYLALPYYDEINSITSEKLADESMNDIVGGEVLVSFFGAIGVAFGIGTMVTGVYTTAAIAGGVGITAASVGAVALAVGGVAATVGVVAEGEISTSKGK